MNLPAINWKLRLRNRATLTALISTAAALIYQLLALLGIAPTVERSTVLQYAGMVVQVLCLLGIVVDPTTAGVGDSAQALDYSKPKEG